MQLSKFISPIVASVVVSAFAAACGTSDCEGEGCFGTSGGRAGQGGSSGRGGQNTGGSGGAGLGGSSAEGGVPGEAGGTPGGGATAGASGAGADGAGAGGAATGGSSAAGEGGSGGEGGSPVACDETRSPLEEACRVTDEAAIFVSPLGDDAADGSREAPLASLTAAIALAAESGKFVAACTGTFQENLAVQGDVAVELYGGFDCDNGWAAGAPVTIVAPNQGLPLSLVDVTERVHIEAFEFRAADATIAGTNSIAASVINSSDVTLRALTLVAGNGADGVDGKTVGFDLPTAESLNGKAAAGVGLAGGAVCFVACPAGGSTQGGRGGDGAGLAPAEPGAVGLPSYDLTSGKGGAIGMTCAGSGSGGDGAAAPPPLSGAGAESPGLLDDKGWTPSIGVAGAIGAIGQGGGGGRGGDAVGGKATGGGGGGGGCGGCGGKGGAAGGGGGGSIALLVVNSGLLLEDSQLTTGQGGKGGAGAAGQPGQLGGERGNSGGNGCDGGAGGSGASGGAGGGGAGGISVGVLFTGPRVVTIAPSVPHTPGRPGAGGLGAATPAGTNNGIAGVAQRVLEL